MVDEVIKDFDIFYTIVCFTIMIVTNKRHILTLFNQHLINCVI